MLTELELNLRTPGKDYPVLVVPLTPVTMIGGHSRLLMALQLSTHRWVADKYLVDHYVGHAWHYTEYDELIRATFKAPRELGYNVIVTTQSLEMIHAFYRVAKATGEPFSYVRIEETQSGRLQAVTYDMEALEGAIEVLELELR
jgi:hypothetical protein